MIKTFSMTDMGMKRKVNQDFVYTCESPIGGLSNLFIVCDGMGGHKAGDYASRYATQTIVKSIEDSTQTGAIRIITDAVEAANSYIFEKASREEEYAGMGTTCVVATIEGDTLVVANVGDSRLYVIDDEIHQITKDHSLVEEMIRVGELDRASARNHPDKNIITRAVGASAEVRIDFFDVHLKQGDLILMCSDGLSNMVDDEEVRMILARGDDVVTCVEKLIARANDNGGRDNIAVVVIDPFGKE